MIDDMRFSVFAILLLTGCAHYELVWVRPDKSQSDDGFKMDRYKCERDARTSAVVGRGIFTRAVTEFDEGFYDECMNAKGWEKRRRLVAEK